MTSILRALALRFIRQRAWIPALLVPALLASGAGLLSVDGPTGADPAARASGVLLACFHHLLPPLAALFLLASPERDQLELLLSRPIGWRSILLARWLGGVALFGGCLLVLALGHTLAISGAIHGSIGGSEGGPPGRLSREPDARFSGKPGGDRRPAAGLFRPWPSRGIDPDWLKAVQSAGTWWFEFTGLPPGSACLVRGRALIGRVITERSPGAAGPAPRQELARADSIPVQAAVLPGVGQEKLLPLGRIELREDGPVDIPIPPGAVGSDGRLRLGLSAVEEEILPVGPTEWGPRFFWFDPRNEGSDGSLGGDDHLFPCDVRLVDGEVSYAENVLRASLLPLGELAFLAALAAASAALFSQGLAYGITLTIYLFALALPFLTDVAQTLSQGSALSLLADPASHAPGAEPAAFERALRSLLDAFRAILPDLSRFDGRPRLEAGEAVTAGEILGAAGRGMGYAAALWFAALLGTATREPAVQR